MVHQIHNMAMKLQKELDYGLQLKIALLGCSGVGGHCTEKLGKSHFMFMQPCQSVKFSANAVYLN